MSRNDIINTLLFKPLVRQFVKAGSGSGVADVDILDDSNQITITKSKVGTKQIFTIGDQAVTGGGGGGTVTQVAVYRGVYEFPSVPASVVEATSPQNSTLKNTTFTFDTGNGAYWWLALPAGTVAAFYFGVTNVQPYVQEGVTVNGNAYDIYVAPSKTVGSVSIRVDALSLPSSSPTAPDTVKPEITLSSSEGSTTTLTVIPITVSVSKSVIGLELSDIQVANGSAQNLSGSGPSYSFEVVPDSVGDVIIQIPANTCQDSFGNLNNASNQLTINYTTSPTLNPSISNVQVSPNPVEQFEELTISWTRQDVGGVTVKLLKSGVEVRSLTSNLNANSYTWSVPIDEPTGTDYRIRVESGAVNAQSSLFEIAPIDDAYTMAEYDQLT